MILKNNEWELLDRICDYLMVSEDKKAQEHYIELAMLLNTLLERKSKRNTYAYNKIKEKRKTDKSYCQRKYDNSLED